jgi:glycosyltransferase involved in cell wall biosynthesis
LCFKKNKNQKFLCASSYCQKDIKALSPKLANFCYKWGYFPHIDVTKNRPLLKERKIRFLFVGRFLPWKHPEICLSTAKYLKKQNVDFEILIIGCGKLGDKLSTKIAKMGMERQVKILGSVKNSSMAEYYCKSDCFLFASGRKEGWGAVLNEAMAYGCVPIACAKAGSTKFLIENDKAGFTYSSKKEFFQDLDKVVEAKKTNKLQTFSDNAKAVIQQEWNGKNAARRLVEECNSLLGIKKKTAKTIGVMAKI